MPVNSRRRLLLRVSRRLHFFPRGKVNAAENLHPQNGYRKQQEKRVYQGAGHGKIRQNQIVSAMENDGCQNRKRLSGGEAFAEKHAGSADQQGKNMQQIGREQPGKHRAGEIKQSRKCFQGSKKRAFQHCGKKGDGFGNTVQFPAGKKHALQDKEKKHRLARFFQQTGLHERMQQKRARVPGINHKFREKRLCQCPQNRYGHHRQHGRGQKQRQIPAHIPAGNKHIQNPQHRKNKAKKQIQKKHTGAYHILRVF